MTEISPPADERSGGSRIAVIDKAVRTLDVVATAADGLTPTEVAAAVGTNRSTAFRLLTSLESAGLLSRDAVTGRYRLGMKLLRYGAAVRNGMSVIKLAEPILMNLRDETRQSCLLAIREGWGARCVFRIPGPEVDILSWATGEWIPLDAGAAPEALLSALGDGEIERYLAHDTDRRGRTADDVRAGVAETRRRGWALHRDGATEGIASLGVAVRDAEGTVACAISVAGLAHHYGEPHLERTASAVLAAAARISDRLTP